jgi:hypothetical protein
VPLGCIRVEVSRGSTSLDTFQITVRKQNNYLGEVINYMGKGGEYSAAVAPL